MTIIHRFSDLLELNNYISSSISEHSMIQLNLNNIQEYAERFSLSPSLIHDIQNNNDNLITYHLYIGSKTSYRKNVHSDIPNVLYKKIYNCFKLNGYIREANGTCVVLCLKPITQEVYDQISHSSDLDNQKVLNQLIDNFSNVSADNQYYIDYIKALENKCDILSFENENLKTQIHNTKISTWY
jgi:hypothetical protein